MAPRARVTLVTGASPGARERAICAALAGAAPARADAPASDAASSDAASSDTVLSDTTPAGAAHGSVSRLDAAVILEGLADAASPLESNAHLAVARIAGGCLCCAGNLVLRVTLNRLLRQQPARLYIGVGSSDHLDQLRSWLSAPPYDQLLELAPELHA